MTADEEVEEFLEHFGVQGMKWGVRKSKQGVSSAKAKLKARSDRINAMTPRQRQRRTEKITRRVVIGGLAAVWVAALIADKGKGGTPVKHLSRGGKVNVGGENVLNNRAAILRAQEAHRNGAYQVRKNLERMGPLAVDMLKQR